MLAQCRALSIVMLRWTRLLILAVCGALTLPTAAAAGEFEFSPDGVLWYLPRENVRLVEPAPNLTFQATAFAAGFGRRPEMPLYFYRLPLVDIEGVESEDWQDIAAFLDATSRSHRIGRIELLDVIMTEPMSSDLHDDENRVGDLDSVAKWIVAENGVQRSWDLAWRGLTDARLRGRDIDTKEVYGALVQQLVDKGVLDEAPPSDADHERQYMLLGFNLPLQGFDDKFLGRAVMQSSRAMVNATPAEPPLR